MDISVEDRMSVGDRISCMSFLNQGGFVLDFTTKGFNDFTESIVGIPLAQKYAESKGRSLDAYVREHPENAIKLFDALLKHYEQSSQIETDRNKNPDRYRQYEECKAIIDKYNKRDINSVRVAQIESKFGNDYIRSQIKLMLEMQANNPTEAIGKAKELIESCCKTILEKVNISIDPNWTMVNLVDRVFEHLKIMPRDISDKAKGVESIRKVLGSLKAVAPGIVELRNIYGSGHGKPGSYQGLESRHAQLAVGSSITLVLFLWDSYERKYLSENPKS